MNVNTADAACMFLHSSEVRIFLKLKMKMHFYQN